MSDHREYRLRYSCPCGTHWEVYNPDEHHQNTCPECERLTVAWETLGGESYDNE